MHNDGVGAEPAAPGHWLCRGCCAPSLQLPARVSPLPKPPGSAFPLPSVGAAGGGALPKWLAAGKEVALEEPLPDVHSCVHATAAPSAAPASPCARLRGEAGGAGRGDGVHICQAAVSPRDTWRGRRDRSCCRSAVPAKAGTSPARPPGASPCLVLTKSSEWDFQYFLWQRSLQPNYLTLTSFLFV